MDPSIGDLNRVTRLALVALLSTLILGYCSDEPQEKWQPEPGDYMESWRDYN